MKISVITVCFNSASTIEKTLQSVCSQDHRDLEYIIIDGGSADNTLEIVDKYRSRITKVVSESDEGMYDALNKGLKLVTGEIVAILNSDDFYVDDEVLSDVAEKFGETGADAVYGDLQYVRNDENFTVFRTWKSGSYSHGMFLNGWMPPHPSFFVRKAVYERYGSFNTKLTSAADYELMLRFIHKFRIKVVYLPRILVKMRVGGKSNSSFSNRLKANREDRLAWELNGLTPRFYTLFLKPLRKIGQFFG